MYAQELKAFKERHKIKSADAWAETTGVSKSTIVRGLKGEGKDIGVNTLLMLIKPYGETLDQLLNMGAYSPEEIAKNEIAEKIEGVIDEIENSPAIPDKPAEEIVAVLAEAQEFITKTPTEEKCSACDVLREMIAVLTEDKETKNKWIVNTFKLSFVLLLIVFAMIIIDGILIMSIINMAK
jgi:hypothetical protein